MASRFYLLKNFNNYYNRIIKKHDTVSDYLTEVGTGNYAIRGNSTQATNPGGIGGCNFNINDGVTAEITYNYDNTQTWQPDYVLVTDDSDNILYRFFVIEAVRTRRGQYHIQLRRDVIADHYTELLTAPAFIERGMLSKDDSFIFNSEGDTYNQIKDEDEVLLKDKTQRAWIVGYTSKLNDSADDITCYGHLYHEPEYTTSSSISDFVENSIGYKGPSIDWNNGNSWRMTVYAEGETLYNYIYEYVLRGSGGATYMRSIGRYQNTYAWRESGSRAECETKLGNAWTSTYEGYLKAMVEDRFNLDAVSSSTISNFLNYNGAIVKSTYNGTTKYYAIRVTSETVNSDYYTESITSSNYNALYGAIDACCNNAFTSGHGSVKNYSVSNSNLVIYRVNYHELATPETKVRVTLSKTNRQLEDSPYCMFCIPYSDTVYLTDEKTGTMTIRDGLAAAFGIAEALSGSGGLYDLQLLPYCPMEESWNTNDGGFIDVRNKTEDIAYSYIIDDGSGTAATVGIVYWCTSSTGTKNITVTGLDDPSTALATKIENETSIYRLTSPNYAGSFEFNIAKNGGVTSVNVDYAYKPFTPYIHVNPIFGRLYGLDTNDARGLICAGDFSLPQTSDAWQTFQVQNKNYLNSFSRELEHMDTMHKYDVTEQRWKVAAGTLQGTASGAVAGSAGGAAGIAVGAIAGTGMTVAAGLKDLEILEGRFKENRTYASDTFNMNNQNVQARPDTISKVSGFNPNNKMFPFLEHYHASDKEIQALTSKITWSSMKVERYGAITDFLQSSQSFIKGKFIRLDNIVDDYHMSSEIAKEFEQGVFI